VSRAGAGHGGKEGDGGAMALGGLLRDKAFPKRQTCRSRSRNCKGSRPARQKMAPPGTPKPQPSPSELMAKPGMAQTGPRPCQYHHHPTARYLAGRGKGEGGGGFADQPLQATNCCNCNFGGSRCDTGVCRGSRSGLTTRDSGSSGARIGPSEKRTCQLDM
jgi:hypothetical protein